MWSASRRCLERRRSGSLRGWDCGRFKSLISGSEEKLSQDEWAALTQEDVTAQLHGRCQKRPVGRGEKRRSGESRRWIKCCQKAFLQLWHLVSLFDPIYDTVCEWRFSHSTEHDSMLNMCIFETSCHHIVKMASHT